MNKGLSVMELGELGNLRLKKSEYEAFIEEFPEDYSERIYELSLYMASSGREYKDHYATLKVFSKKRFPRDSGSSSLLAKGEPYHSSLIAPRSSLITNNSELTAGNGVNNDERATMSDKTRPWRATMNVASRSSGGDGKANDYSSVSSADTFPHKGRRMRNRCFISLPLLFRPRAWLFRAAFDAPAPRGGAAFRLLFSPCASRRAYREASFSLRAPPLLLFSVP